MSEGGTTWKQTVDGQWQLFSDYNPKGASGGEIYEASAISIGNDKKCEEMETEQIQISATVWTPKGYGSVNEVNKQEEKEKTATSIKVKVEGAKEGESEEHSFNSEEVRRKIEVAMRMMQGHKLEWLRVEVPINKKVSDLIDLLSNYYEKSSFFMSLFHAGKTLDKKQTLAEAKINHMDMLLGSMNSGKAKVFKRFRDVSTSYWYVVSSWDAIIFKCERALMIMGFGVYKHYYCDTFSVRYKIFKEDDEVLTEQTGDISPANLVDKVGTINLKAPILIPAKTNFTIMYIFNPVSGQSNHAHYGQNGGTPCDIEGNEKIFEVIYSSRDQNGTSVDTGQIPELHYIPM